MPFFALIIVIVIIKLAWFWNFLLNHPNYKKVQWPDIAEKVKTGDLILFHALDNINSAFIGCYYTHIGIVYRETPTSPPFIFEAWNPSESDIYPAELKHGMAFVDLQCRLQSYRGYVFYKELARPLHAGQSEDFYQFIYWAMHNLRYNKRVIANGINKLIFNDKLRRGTNCGELVYMALIKLGLLARSRFHNNRLHHLKWLCELVQTDVANYYKTPVYVWQSQFSISAHTKK